MNNIERINQEHKAIRKTIQRQFWRDLAQMAFGAVVFMALGMLLIGFFG